MNKETKHTPGPWEIERIYTDDEIMGSLTILAADGCPVCKTNHSLISRNRSTPEILANALLISAAPDMLRILIDLTNLADGKFDGLKYHAEDNSEEAEEEMLDIIRWIMAAAKATIEKATI